MALNDLGFAVHRPAPWGAGIFFVLALGLVGLGVANGKVAELALVAVLPATLSVALLVARRPEIEGTVTDEGIELYRPPMLIPFEAIRRVKAKGVDLGEPLPPHFPMEVEHGRGVLKIPEGHDIHAAAIYQALMKRYAPGGSREINPALTPYASRHEANFGPERIWTFRADPTRQGRDVHRPRRGVGIGLALIVTGIAWLVAGFAKGVDAPGNPWAGLAILTLIVGFFWLLIALVAGAQNRTHGIKKWKESSLVITPVGLALIQGDIQGELFWDQLRDVKYKEKATSFQLSSDPNLSGIILVVEGAKIAIADLYDRPLATIHERILRYWKPERLKAPVDY